MGPKGAFRLALAGALSLPLAAAIPGPASSRQAFAVPPLSARSTAGDRLPASSAGPSVPDSESPPLAGDEAMRQFVRGVFVETQGDLREAYDALFHTRLVDPMSPTVFRHLARTLLHAGDTERAANLAEEGLRLDATDARLHYLRATALYAGNHVEEALTDFELAAANDSTNAEYALALARQYERLDRLEDASRMYERATSYSDPEPETELRLATILGRLGRFKEALPLLDHVAEQEPDLPQLLITRAWVVDELGRHEEAVDAYQRYLRDYPSDRIVRRRLINALLGLGRAREALPYAQKLYAEAPSAAEGRVLVGLDLRLGDVEGARRLALEMRKRWPDDYDVAEVAVAVLVRTKSIDQAVSQAKQAAQTSPTDFRSWILYASTLVVAKRDDDAISALARAEQAAPDSGPAQVALGRAYFAASRFARAESLYARALALGADSASAWYEIASARERQRDLGGAEDAIKQVIVHEPDNPQALNFLGYLYADANRNLSEAVRLIRRALELDPKNGYFMDSLGWAYYRLGQLDSARTELERAVQTGGEDPTILEHLGDVYLALERPILAKEKYRRALELTPENQMLRDKMKKLR